MNKLWTLLTLGAAVSGFAMRSWGEVVIEGSVKMPPVKPLAVAASRYQQKAGAVAGPEPPVAVVYLEGSFPATAPSSSVVEKVMQKSYQFSPGILPVRRGTKVEFPNLDDDYHHVFSYSKAKEFDLGRYRKDEKPPPAVIFDKTGVIKVGCEIHDHMRAYILVLDTPYFTKADSSGTFRLVLKDVSPGKYTLKAWVNERTTWEQPVELQEGATLQVNFPRP